MSAKRFFALAVIVGLLFNAAEGAAKLNDADFNTRKQKISENTPLHLDGMAADATELMLNGDWERLDALGGKLRKERTRSRNGNWELTYYYGNLARWWTGFTPSREEWLHSRLDEWVEAKPESAKPLIAKARAYVDFAWEVRGEGYAYTVTSEGWKEFEIRMSKAKKLLAEAAEKDPCEPEIYHLLLAAGKATSIGKLKMKEIFDIGVKVEPSYIPMYYEMAHASMVRWGGQKGVVENFMDLAVQLTAATEGESLYARIADYLFMYFGPTEFKREFNIPYERLKNSYWDLVERYPQANYYLNRFCFWAYIENDIDTGGQLLGMIGDNIDVKAWRGRDNYERFRNRVRGKNSDATDKKPEQVAAPKQARYSDEKRVHAKIQGYPSSDGRYRRCKEVGNKQPAIDSKADAT